MKLRPAVSPPYRYLRGRDSGDKVLEGLIMNKQRPENFQVMKKLWPTTFEVLAICQDLEFMASRCGMISRTGPRRSALFAESLPIKISVAMYFLANLREVIAPIMISKIGRDNRL